MSKGVKFAAFSVVMVALVACGGTSSGQIEAVAPQGQPPAGDVAGQPAQGSQQLAQPQVGQAQPVQSQPSGQPATGLSAAQREQPDLASLPIGDGFLSSSPQAGYVWSCRIEFNGRGADAVGDWYDAATGTWNLTIKPTVDGSVSWQSEVSAAIEGATRVITANGVPFHTTGVYPVATSDDAYQYDRNPNSITTQSYSLELPANPVLAAQPSCVGGEVGIAINGVVINNALDAVGRDAVATEIQDTCSGHPHQGGVYHYHGYSSCLEGEGTGHSELIGWALDGFGIYGPYGENGEVLDSGDLDECHGHTHTITWDGQQVNMFHYHATYTYPYTVGCFRGTAVTFRTGTGGGATGGGPAGQPPTGGGLGGPPPTGGKGG